MLGSSWADSMQRLLAADGELVTLIFPVKEYDGGPPYSMSPKLVRGLLEPKFSSKSIEEVPKEKLARGTFAAEFLGRWRRTPSE